MVNTDIRKILESFTEDQGKDIKCFYDLIEESNDTIMVSPVGSINSYNIDFFQNKMDKLLDNGCKNLIFDMSGTIYVSAVGIGSFVHIFEKAKNNGGQVILNNMQKHVLEIFQLPGFIEYFSIDEDSCSAVFNNGYKIS